jgi:DNA polymerase I-like protein with 3'-5' exonuclease and polymerase domains
MSSMPSSYGILAHGFLRLRCGECGHDKLPHMVNPQTGRVHSSYAQSVAVTSRLAPTDPNLQGIPIRTVEGR